MVAVQVRYGDTFYIIGDFWEIVDWLKAHRAYFRFRARRWRWPESLSVLEKTMQPFAVLEISRSEAQGLQLRYDVEHIGPTQVWLKVQASLAQASVEWWEATKLKDSTNKRQKKEFETHRERVELALASLNTPPADLSREAIVAMQQTQRLVEKYEQRVVKWVGERAKVRRREALLSRFEREMGLTRENLVEAEEARGAARQALYEEVAALDWQPVELAELKAAARFLVTQERKEAKRKEKVG